MKTAVMYGAGNVGRGFLGQLFSESGYEVVFIDIAPALLAALNERRSYRLRLVSNQGSEDIVVRNVRAVSGQDVEAIAAEIATADIMATAVGANILSRIAPAIAAGIARRAMLDEARPLNIIVCENLKDAPRILYGYLEARLQQAGLPADHRAQALSYLATQVGLVDAVIGRMVPLVPPELQQQDPSLVLAEPYKVLPVNRAGFVGEIPAIVGLEAHDHFEAYVDRKLYLHNAGHAMLGYLGHLKGLIYGYEALEDADIRPWLLRALGESQRALVAAHGLDAAKLDAHVQDLLHRFANRALGDTVFRLARDPVRKLGRSDRLVGAALLALAQGIRPEALAMGIAAALSFDDPQDSAALELQKRIAERGLDAVLSAVCGLDPKDELAQMIRARYTDIQQGRLFA
jgi:mannitol-1-phosphate 5-dehydrogenase